MAQHRSSRGDAVMEKRMVDAKAKGTGKKMAVLVADAFQDSEYMLPKIEIEKMGVETEVVSISDKPVRMWSFFDELGTIDVVKTIDQANPSDYVGVLIPGGAKSPKTLSDDARVKAFVRKIGEDGKLVASICRGSLLAAEAGAARGKDITGFHHPDQWPELAISERVEELGGKWHNDKAAIRDDNLVSSRHPDDCQAFADEIAGWLEDNS